MSDTSQLIHELIDSQDRELERLRADCDQKAKLIACLEVRGVLNPVAVRAGKIEGLRLALSYKNTNAYGAEVVHYSHIEREIASLLAEQAQEWQRSA